MNINNFFICYYSGTGNSYLTALHIQQALENSKLYDLLTYRGEKLACKTLMIVFPVHMYGAPPIVLDFIKQLDVNQDTLIYAIATCGGISGEALWQVDQERLYGK